MKLKNKLKKTPNKKDKTQIDFPQKSKQKSLKILFFKLKTHLIMAEYTQGRDLKGAGKDQQNHVEFSQPGLFSWSHLNSLFM